METSMKKSSHLVRSGNSARLATGLVAGKYSAPAIKGAGPGHVSPETCACWCEGGEGAGAGAGKTKLT
jgi:hypothetical protein